jgi:hypothetical protein
MDHIEYLKSGFEKAQKRFQETQQRMQAMQLEFNKMAQEFNAWQTLYQAEMAKQGNDLIAPPPTISLTFNGRRLHNAQIQPLKSSKPSQTEVVRNALKERQAGLTPNEIWKEVESQMVNRTYLYSVLKRLKERGDVFERRGKYYPKPQVDGVGGVVQ